MIFEPATFALTLDSRQAFDKSHLAFLRTLIELSQSHRDECEIEGDEAEYIAKKMALLERSIDLIDLFRAKKCNGENLAKALTIVDNQIADLGA